MGGDNYMNASLNSDIYKAWTGFVNKGIILEGTIRTEIIESWQRSRGIDPFAEHRHQLPNRMLQAKLVENVQLISLARPIMRDISEVEGLDFVALSDPDGYIVDVAGDPQYYELLGLRFSEVDIGTNAIGTALVEDKALEVKGSEHYCHCHHSAYGAAVPQFTTLEIQSSVYWQFTMFQLHYQVVYYRPLNWA
jgi:transcriptional regulator of acetoin/glycerol metabolism